MIKDNQNFNESIKPNSDFLTELKEKLPEFFNGESEFDLPKFKSLLKENNIYDELTSGNQLNFIGKEYARKQGGERPTTVVVPDIEHNKSSENENSQNIFFTGDNLEVLRHMQNYYQNSIDMVYIDPPYNTGNDDFIYPDNFEYNDEKLQSMFGLNDEELNKLKSIQGKATHSAWLTFMHPRLYLAKKLLKPEGVIFVSIDDNELFNLKLMCDEIFGEENVECMVWNKISDKGSAGQGKMKITYRFRKDHEYVLVIYKNKKKTLFNKPLRIKTFKNKYPNVDNDPRGNWVSSEICKSEEKSNPQGKNFYEVTTPKGKKYARQWHVDIEEFEQLDEDNRIYWGKGTTVPRHKRFVNEPQPSTPASIISDISQTDGNRDFKNLFDDLLFDNPKPTKLIKWLIEIATEKNDTIMDFFAGSSTTADAVMQLNAEDGGNRRFIMATKPEPTYEIKDNGEKVGTKGGKQAFEAGYNNVSQLSRERIRLASKKICEENSLDLFDGSYKHYVVIEPNEPALDLIDNFKSVKESLFDNMIDPFSSDSLDVGGGASGVDTILTTWLLADGYSLDAKIEKKDFIGYSADFVEDTRLYLIKGDGWGAEQTRELLNQIGKNQFSLQTIVYYKYHFDMETINELQLGLSQLDKNIKLLGRF